MRIIEQSAIIEDWSAMSLARRVERAARLCYGRANEKEPRAFVKALVEKKHFSPLEFARVNLHGSIMIHGTMNLRDLRRESLTEATMPALFAYLISKDCPEFFEDIQHRWHKPHWDEGANNPLKYTVDDSWIPVLITTNRAISHQLVRHRHDIAVMQESQRFTIMRDNVDFIRPSAFWKPGTSDEDIWIDAMMEAEHEYAAALEKGNSAQAARLFLPNSTATRILLYASPKEWAYIFKLRCSPKADPTMRQLMCPLRDEMLNREMVHQDWIDEAGRYS